ncbi:TrbC/VirB2 family protein [Rickettsia endosymbiont of Ceutorhynchus obstrictus]|uniref:TrbC/VirB2 family protein n=1 Tax=Rickettsia endosymbiont of Ceutorhynchus obstrictus TaxID=3066249 RepID=UPI003132D285
MKVISNIYLTVIVLILTVFITNTANAAIGYDANDPIGSAFCLFYYKRNNIVRAIAVIGVVALGIQSLRGRISWVTTLIVTTGIILMIKGDVILRFILKITSGDGGYVCR